MPWMTYLFVANELVICQTPLWINEVGMGKCVLDAAVKTCLYKD